jgi:probable F420-dependent oxidoreductase
MLSFGVTVLPDPPYTRMIELMKLAEQHGFEYAWTYDSHILWQESYATLPIAAVQTEKIKFGHFVTNPGIRDPTITASWYATAQDISNGRMVMGIGRGDSSRRVVGLKPVKVADFEARCAMIKELMNGREVEWNEKQLKLEWVREELPDIPMWIAGYGPKALAVAGRVSDGVIIQLADPVIVVWIMATARKAAEEAGRDPDALQCIVGAPSKVTDDLAEAREEVRWFPAMVSNHVMDLIERYGWDSDIPSELTDFVKTRKGYDYKDHSRVGAKHGEFVSDEICDRFCVIGSAEQCTQKLRELEAVGVDQFNVYLMTHGQDEQLRAYGREIIPQFAGAVA